MTTPPTYEIIETVRPVRVTLQCAECHEAMQAEPGTLLSNPPQYRHFCLRCGAIAVTRDRYPLIRYDDDESVPPPSCLHDNGADHAGRCNRCGVPI